MEKGEEQLYGTAAAPVIKWHEAWTERKLVHYIVDWFAWIRGGWN